MSLGIRYLSFLVRNIILHDYCHKFGVQYIKYLIMHFTIFEHCKINLSKLNLMYCFVPLLG